MVDEKTTTVTRVGMVARPFGTKGIEPIGGFSGYEPLVVEIVRFFKTHKPPVTAEETLEIYAFMEAADESRRRDSAHAVRLTDVLSKARREAQIRLDPLLAAPATADPRR